MEITSATAIIDLHTPAAGRAMDETDSGVDRKCSCGQEPGKLSRQNSPLHHRRPDFTGVANPPTVYTADQESDFVSGHSSPLSLDVQLQLAQSQITQLLREKKDAFQQVKEVTKMNTRWQKYDKEREEVVGDLTSKLRSAQEQVRELTEKVQHQEAKISDLRGQNEDLELRWTDARVRAAERKSEVERLQQEMQTLERNMEESEKKHQEVIQRLETTAKKQQNDLVKEKKDVDKDRDLFYMSKRIVDLKERVDYLERQRASVKKQLQEQGSLYTQQISICLDDFKQEKKDKERAKRESDELKKQLKKAEDFASSLKAQITRYQNQRLSIPRRVHLTSGQLNKYYANSEELEESWDDAGYTLPSDVVPDHAVGFDDIDGGVSHHVHVPSAVHDPPPQYDDRSIMGQVVLPTPCRIPQEVPSHRISRQNDLVLH